MRQMLKFTFMGLWRFFTLILTYSVYCLLWIPLYIRYKLESNRDKQSLKHPIRFLISSFRLFDKSFGKFF